MAIAKKCDRCGSFYGYSKNSEDNRAHNIIDTTSRNFIDLCDDCQSSLEDWIKEKEESAIGAPRIIGFDLVAAPIYGVLGLCGSDTYLTRTDDAVGLSFEIDRSSGAITSDFNDVFPWNVAEVVDDAAGKFVSFPEMYFRIGTDESDRITDVAVSARPSGSGNWHRVAPFMYGCYGASIDADKMLSVPGVKRSGNRTREQFRDLAFSTGNGYIPVDLYHRNVLMLLWWIEFATKDSRSIMTGRIYKSGNKSGCSIRPCGGTDSVPTPSGYEPEYDQMRYHYIEDFIGNVWEMIDGICMSGEGERDYVTADPTKFNDSPADKSALPWVNPTSDVVAAYGWDPDNPFLFMPIETVKNSDCNTHFCNYVFHCSGFPVLLAGAGYDDSGAGCGLSYVLYTSASHNNAGYGSRLLKILRGGSGDTSLESLYCKRSD